MRNDRWSNPSEIKRALCAGGEYGKGGPILYHNNGRNWVYPNEGHTIFLGVSGSGKSRRGTIPMIKGFIESEESFVVVDPKGEIHYHTAADAEGKYNIHVIDFRHIFESERWNPLAAPYELFISGNPVKKQIAMEMVDDLAHTLYVVSGKADPFWVESARSVFIGAVYALMMLGKPEQVNMAGVYQLIARGEERMGGSMVLKEFVDGLPIDSVAAMMLQSYVTTANDTRAGIRSTFLEGLSMFARSEGLMSMLGADDLHINKLDGITPTAIYIILPDESPIFDSISGVLCSQIMGHYVRIAQDEYDGKLPCRLNVCLEELGNIGKSISSLAHLMSAGRSRNIRCQLVLQSLSQLDTLYGPSEASTIRSNADVMIAFRVNHWETLTELAHKCGEREVDSGRHVSREGLISPSQLACMQTGQALVMISGHTKFITWLPDFTEMFDCSQWREPKRVVRKANKPVAVFNIKEYVQEAKKKKLRAMMEENQEPFAAPPRAGWRENPFGSSNDSGKKTGRSEKAIDVDGLIAQIDAKIAQLEAEEAAEKAKKGQEAAGKVGPRNAILVSAGASKLAIIRIIREFTQMDLKQAKTAMESVPFTFSFPSEKRAKEFVSEINAAGGTAIVGTNKDAQ